MKDKCIVCGVPLSALTL